MKQKICAVFDIGRDAKRLVLFDEQLKEIEVQVIDIPTRTDDEGFRSEDIKAIGNWIVSTFEALTKSAVYDLKAVNFVSYAGAIVHLDKAGNPLEPNYDVLKPVSYDFKKAFFEEITNSESLFSETQTPFLGHLNAGVQLFWLKNTKPTYFKKINHSLFLPQYGCFLLTGKFTADFSGLQCHSMLLDESSQQYHDWLINQQFNTILPEVLPFSSTFPALKNPSINVGVGMQGTAAALLPYMADVEPFVLSTSAAWTINSNPFAKKRLSIKQLDEHAFSFKLLDKEYVHSTRVFAGNEHERQVKHLSDYFGKPLDYYKSVVYNPNLIWDLRNRFKQATPDTANTQLLFDCPFSERNLNQFRNYEEAYHQFMQDLVAQEVASLKLVLGYSSIRKIIIEGNFTTNTLYIELMNEAFFDKFIFINDNGSSRALGAAMAIAPQWSSVSTNNFSIELRRV